MDAVITFDPLDPAFLADPYAVMADLREHAPVHYVDHLDIWTVARHDDVASILRRPTEFSSELGLGRGWTLVDERPPAKEMSFQAGLPGISVLIGADGPAHAVLRHMLAPAFSRSSLAALRPGMDAVADRLWDGVTARMDEPVDLVPAVAEPMAAQSLAFALGLPSSVASSLSKWANAVTRSWDPTHPNSLASSYRRLARQGWDMLRELRAMLLLAPPGGGWSGAVGAMVDARRRNPSIISEMEVLSNVVLLVLAGVHTTTSGLGSVLRLLVHRPHLVEDLRVGRTSAAALTEEALRLESPIQASWRGTRTDAVVGSTTIPAGARIWLMFGSANRDERRYDRASELVVGRRGPHLTFGMGAHYCIGAQLAAAEIVAAVERFTALGLKLEPAGPARSTTNLIVRGVSSLPVRVRR